MTVPQRLLLGPGPSPVSERVMRALSSPVLSHLDPYLLEVLDSLRARLASTFRAAPDALTLAISGTGTSGMEAAVANLAEPGTKATVVVTGYFGDRLAQILERHGAEVERIEVEWGRACDPARVEDALRRRPADLVGIVQAETSTGVLNPVDDIAGIAQRHGSIVIVDAVTSLGAMPVNVSTWGTAVCYSCSQKGLGAPSGLAPITFSAAALTRRVFCRSFYLDIGLLEDYWLRRKYHHTISAPLILALHEALAIVEEEGLDARHTRHEQNHNALVEGLSTLGLTLLPPEKERLWTLNAVRVPDGVNEAGVRRHLLDKYGIEIGAGLGPLAGRIWRVGLMGAGSTRANVDLFLSALGTAVTASRGGPSVRH
ncbi:MAG: alanine--glyoxylate aminotransferase family protein [Acidobacteria bacterium]|nr:alanine--glyoxylate aminotransferase family protein [Acidobacteriota bacterium]